jgi:GT2 family glycosyltransferase
MPQPIAVLTLVRGRGSHLANLLEGLARGSRRPDLCVVADMNDQPAALPDTPFPLRRLHLPAGSLPLAAARNAAARAANTPLLAFLDVDCIPGASCVAALAEALESQDALVCADIRYLPAGAAAPGWDEASLLRQGQSHPVRPFPATGLRAEPNTGLFWSLAFGIRGASFERLGGFDEGFVGYGAEDTDLGFRARDAGIPLLLSGDARAFHQHHPSYDPPLPHVAAIAANAWRFRQRHGFWPMQGWLDGFAALGLIEPPGDGPIRLLRLPVEAELAAALRPEGAAF